jgi:hemerythrin
MAYSTGTPLTIPALPVSTTSTSVVALLNEIHGLILNGAEPHKIAGTLANFHARAAAHLALEEKIMQDRNFPGLRERRDTR